MQPEAEEDLGIGTLGQRSKRRLRIGKLEEQATHAEIADFAGDVTEAGLCDQGLE